MDEFKRCAKCQVVKDSMRDFYLCGNTWRRECKMCTIKHNGLYQKKRRAWKPRYVSDDASKLYKRTYYNNNKDKFAKYRATFREKHPEYYREYFRRRKEKGE